MSATAIVTIHLCMRPPEKGWASVQTARQSFANHLIEQVVIHPVEERRDLNAGIDPAQSRRFLDHELDLVPDPELRRAVGEVALGAVAVPAGVGDHPFYELVMPLCELGHAA